MPLPIPRCWNTKKSRRRRRRKKSPRTTSPCQRATGWGRLFFIHATPGNGTPSTSAIIAPTKENPSVPLSSKPARIHFLFRSIFSFLFFCGPSARVSMTVCALLLDHLSRTISQSGWPPPPTAYPHFCLWCGHTCAVTQL